MGTAAGEAEHVRLGKDQPDSLRSHRRKPASRPVRAMAPVWKPAGSVPHCESPAHSARRLASGYGAGTLEAFPSHRGETFFPARL